MKVSSSISRAVLATVVAGAVVAPAAQAMPVHDSQSRGDCVMMARTCLTMDQVRQLDMHASTVVPTAPKGNDVVADIRGEAAKPTPAAPKGNDVVADVRGEASKPAPSTPAIPGLPVFPTDTTPIAAPKPAPVATTTATATATSTGRSRACSPRSPSRWAGPRTSRAASCARTPQPERFHAAKWRVARVGFGPRGALRVCKLADFATLRGKGGRG